MIKFPNMALLLALASIIPLANADASGMTQLECGTVSVDGLNLRIQHKDSNWYSKMQDSASIELQDGYPIKTKDSVTLKGFFKVNHGAKFDFSEELKKKSDGSLDYKAHLRHFSGVPSKLLALAASLKVSEFFHTRLLHNGTPFGFSDNFNEKNWKQAFPVQPTTLQIPLAHGTLTISGTFGVCIQDNRKYNLGRWELWLLFSQSSGDIKDASFQANLQYKPYLSRPLDLRRAANMGFADSHAEDGKGGWTDQGPSNDLRMMSPGSKNFAGIEFNVLNPSENNGKAAIVLQGKARQNFPAKAAVELKNECARYLYLFHGSAWESPVGTPLGKIEVAYSDGTRQDINLNSGEDVSNFWNPHNRKNASVVWNAENGSARIGLYLSRFELKEKKPITGIAFISSGNAVWMIVAATLSDDFAALPKVQPIFITEGKEWRPIHNKFPLVKDSVLDFTFLQDAPAGKYGFIRKNGNQFVFERNPAEVRFYGANICQNALFVDRKNADLMADHFAATGYNLARLHQDDHKLHARKNGTTTELDPYHTDRMDYLFAALKKRGIYITIDLYSRRTLLPGEIPEYPNKAFNISSFKALPFLLESAMKNWEAASEARMNHLNPYTGLAWKDDPALISISLINEDTLYAVWERDPEVRKLCLEKFEQWAKENKFEITEMNRQRNLYRFLSELHAKGYARMSAFLRKLGVKAMLNDQNYWSNVSLALTRNAYDITDTHFYWGHPEFLGKEWSLPAIVANDCAVARAGGSLAATFPTRLFGKPFTVTEWDFVTPGAYTAEGAFLTGAYAALQQWGGLCRFTYTHDPARIGNAEQRLHLFDTLGDPLRALSERAGSMFFLRGDVAPAPVSFPVIVSTEYLNGNANPEHHPDAIAKLGLIGKVGDIVVERGTKPNLPQDASAVLTLEGAYWNNIHFPRPRFKAGKGEDILNSMMNRDILTKEDADLKKGRFTSRTRELILDASQGTFEAVTPLSEGFVLPEKKNASGKFASVRNLQSWASFLIGSRDGLPLEKSRRILLLHLTELKSSHMRFGDGKMTLLEDWGRLPLLMRYGKAELELKGNFEGFHLYAVEFDGSRLFEIPFKQEKGKCGITLENFRKQKAVAAYEFIKE